MSLPNVTISWFSLPLILRKRASLKRFAKAWYLGSKARQGLQYVKPTSSTMSRPLDDSSSSALVYSARVCMSVTSEAITDSFQNTLNSSKLILPEPSMSIWNTRSFTSSAAILTPMRLMASATSSTSSSPLPSLSNSAKTFLMSLLLMAVGLTAWRLPIAARRAARSVRNRSSSFAPKAAPLTPQTGPSWHLWSGVFRSVSRGSSSSYLLPLVPLPPMMKWSGWQKSSSFFR
mmetsp:Transcript_3620/g.9032  ORF Transcript_3620/g.9032 Transcript_3620/m.9032 type:complete len:232 (+) Transcript_3620:342-1037(+)